MDMDKGLLVTPKYLTADVARKAVDVALFASMARDSPIEGMLKRKHCHIVVLVPGMESDRAKDYPRWPNYPLYPISLYERSFGDQDEWEHPYADIARCKALQLWTERNDDRTMVIPHLLFPRDTPYWGGVWRRGFVVTCSGVQPWFDKMVSGIASDTMVALAHDAYENDPERKAGVDFIS